MSEPNNNEIVELRGFLGYVTSYAMAKANGYTGTEAEWVQKMVNCASQQDLDELASDVRYTAIAISSFSCSPATAEMGSTVEEVVLAYNLNKTPATLTLDGAAQPPAKTGTFTRENVSANKTYSLTASDNGSATHSPATATKTASINFYNRVYYGAAAAPETLDGEFLQGLANAILSGTRARTVTVNAPAGQYVWYAVPKRLGACTFKIGGFTGGFEPAQEISVTNASGYTEAYYVYRSTNAGLGAAEIVVS